MGAVERLRVIGTEDADVTHIGKFEPSKTPRFSNENDTSPRAQLIQPWGSAVGATRLNSVSMGILLQYLRQRAANAPLPGSWSTVGPKDLPFRRP
jgi:hypothetical protein